MVRAGLARRDGTEQAMELLAVITEGSEAFIWFGVMCVGIFVALLVTISR